MQVADAVETSWMTPTILLTRIALTDSFCLEYYRQVPLTFYKMASSTKAVQTFGKKKVRVTVYLSRPDCEYSRPSLPDSDCGRACA
jgi:hypothetical protein